MDQPEEPKKVPRFSADRPLPTDVIGELELADEADRLNETCRIYVNLMAANVRRRLQLLTGEGGNAYRRGPVAYA